ncbi:uncharacterized protein LOC132039483 [Lycium ferocissimum]|uniref:uncharacterized protein LOC132039483 n=1 Tax=Lycium ferocissimum TaxID=112874 RepID=UPI002814A3AE|nr:uncharacterized protein LOC132039483 [Lycium ferocissimum]
MHSPKVSHWKTALRIVRYTKQAPGLGLLMPLDDASQLLIMVLIDGCLETGRSVTRYLAKFGGALVFLEVKKRKRKLCQKSPVEAEFRSTASCAAEGENQSRNAETEHIHTKEQLADLFTESLEKAQHQHLLSRLRVKNLFQP